jgi:hypothetical protein
MFKNDPGILWDRSFDSARPAGQIPIHHRSFVFHENPRSRTVGGTISAVRTTPSLAKLPATSLSANARAVAMP